MCHAEAQRRNEEKYQMAFMRGVAAPWRDNFEQPFIN
jgi:hypothetical protein